MADPTTYFSTREHAANYKSFRPFLSDVIVKRIITFLAEKFDIKDCVAVDVGCGSGQSTFPIAKHVQRVIGVEPSQAQLSELEHSSLTTQNVEFKLGTADHLPVDSSSVHLVYAVDAIHWFDVKKFFLEVDRVLISGGVLAIVNGVHSFEIVGYEKESARILREFERTESVGYWDWSRIQLTVDLLRDITFPYAEFERDESIYQERTLSVAHFIGRLKTSSGNAQFLKHKPEKAEEAFKKLETRFLKLFGSASSAEETIITARKQFVVLLSRKP